MMERELSETCRFSFQNKFEKLVHLVGFIIRICHDARSPWRKTQGDILKSVYFKINSKCDICRTFSSHARCPLFLLCSWHKISLLIICIVDRWLYCVHKVQDYPNVGFSHAVAYEYMKNMEDSQILGEVRSFTTNSASALSRVSYFTGKDTRTL